MKLPKVGIYNLRMSWNEEVWFYLISVIPS